MLQPIDNEYAARVSGRVEVLVKKSSTMKEVLKRTKRELVRIKSDVEIETEIFSSELDNLENDADAVVDRVKDTIERFQNVIKKGDFERLKSRVNIWAPEKMISKETFKRMIEDAELS